MSARVILDRAPAEPVEHEQHHGASRPRRLGDPRVVDPAEQRRHDTRPPTHRRTRAAQDPRASSVGVRARTLVPARPAPDARAWRGEGLDARRLRGPRPPLARASRQRPADIGEGDRRAHVPAAALSRADPAVGQGRRPRALEAGRRRRLRARVTPRRTSRSPTSWPRSRDHSSRSRSTPTTAKATASFKRCGSASTRRAAACSSASRSPSSSSGPGSATPTADPPERARAHVGRANVSRLTAEIGGKRDQFGEPSPT